jgi:hypothetical protein
MQTKKKEHFSKRFTIKLSDCVRLLGFWITEGNFYYLSLLNKFTQEPANRPRGSEVHSINFPVSTEANRGGGMKDQLDESDLNQYIHGVHCFGLCQIIFLKMVF